MYQPYSSSRYTSPPPPNDPYRASPIPVMPKQPYTTFSPPPVPPQSNPAAYMRPPQPAYGYQPPVPSNQNRRYPPANYPNSPSNASAPPPGGAPRHKGTLAPGQIVQVGDNSVRIEKYLSEGGYAHVYLTTSERPIYPPNRNSNVGAGKSGGRWGEKGYTQHCLKRIAFEDESVWADVKKEIEVMKALPPNPHLTQYLGSAHTKLARGYEVYILMEFCSGGGIIDLLNKRLRDRLQEIEILNIFTDVCEAVAAMHALRKPLLHRDLKIENVLSSPNGLSPSPARPTPLTFKLCDFGSTTYPSSHPPATKLEAETLALDLNKNTTLQYRSPEMVEPMLGWAVGLPSDVWALGVLLYKLCYYTTPFEEHGTLAIVNAKYTFPQYPVYSPRLQHLIASMLVEQPMRRPSVFEILKMSHEMSGTKPEVDYPTPSQNFNSAPSPQPQASQAPQHSSSNLLDFTSPNSSADRMPAMQPSLVSTVQPQRRGRPTSHRAGASNHGQQASPSGPSAMPVPPTISTQQPTPQSIAKIQVTGDNKQSTLPQKQASIDAFGMPNLTTRSPASSTSGFGDSFANAPVHKFGQKSTPQPGLTHSFGGPRNAGSSSLSPQRLSNLRQNSSSSQNGFSSFNVPRTASPTSLVEAQKPSTSSASVQDENVTFETRFPSIETLSSGDPMSPPLDPSQATSRADSTHQNLISPIVSPPLNSAGYKPNRVGNRTGGDMPQHNLTNSSVGGPQPRSTHVTGTAFKDGQGLLSPGPALSTISTAALADQDGQNRQDYFENLQSKALASPSSSIGRSPLPEDLMTGDDEEMRGGLLKPTFSRVPSGTEATSRPGSSMRSQTPTSNSIPAQSPPATGHSRPLLPHIDSKRPETNFNSESWSPLEQLKGSSQQSETKPVEQVAQGEVPGRKASESSSDEEGPESAERAGKTANNSLANRMSMFEMNDRTATSTPTTKAAQAVMTSPTKLSPTKQQHSFKPSSPTKPVNQGLASSRSQGSKARPVSMYSFPSSSSSHSTNNRLSPPAGPSDSASVGGGFVLPTPDRPRHQRKGSINDIVSKYESLKSPVGGVSGNSVPKEKPSVAAKPTTLRKPTVDEKPSATPKVAPAKPAKPDLIKPTAVRHGNAPAPSGFSRSSSGRSFPVDKPAISTKPTFPNPKSPTLPTAGRDVRTPLENGSGVNTGMPTRKSTGSPEKQQPVNALIARWNQGNVSAERKPVKKSGEGYN